MVIGHSVLHGHLTGQTRLHLRIVLGPIIRGAGSTETAKTPRSPHHLLACVPERLHESDTFRHVLFLTGDLDRHHFRPEYFRLINDVIFFFSSHDFHSQSMGKDRDLCSNASVLPSHNSHMSWTMSARNLGAPDLLDVHKVSPSSAVRNGRSQASSWRSTRRSLVGPQSRNGP